MKRIPVKVLLLFVALALAPDGKDISIKALGFELTITAPGGPKKAAKIPRYCGTG